MCQSLYVYTKCFLTDMNRMDLIQFQEWYCFVDKAIIWFYAQPCTPAYSRAQINPKLTGHFTAVFLHAVCEGRLKCLLYIFSEVKKKQGFSDMDWIFVLASFLHMHHLTVVVTPFS